MRTEIIQRPQFIEWTTRTLREVSAAPGAVDIWLFSLDLGTPQIETAFDNLDTEEKKRAAAFRLPKIVTDLSPAAISSGCYWRNIAGAG